MVEESRQLGVRMKTRNPEERHVFSSHKRSLPRTAKSTMALTQKGPPKSSSATKSVEMPCCKKLTKSKTAKHHSRVRPCGVELNPALPRLTGAHDLVTMAERRRLHVAAGRKSKTAWKLPSEIER